jgi:hypothetical protein
MQGEHTDAVITGITDEEIAGADANAMWLVQLSWPLPLPAETRDSLETALARIEAF